MVKLKTLIVVLCGLILVLSCKDKKQNTESEATIQEQPIEIDDNLKEYGRIFNEILLHDKGQIRGFNIGDNFEEVIHNETAAFLDTNADNIPENEKHFTHHFDKSDINFVDIVYVKNNNGKLSKVILEVFLEKKEQVDSLMNDFKKYYNNKYSKGVVDKNNINWTVKDNVDFQLTDVTTKMDAGCKLVFSEKNSLQ